MTPSERKSMREICGNCGKIFGHHAMMHRKNGHGFEYLCPGSASTMFRSTGKYAEQIPLSNAVNTYGD